FDRLELPLDESAQGSRAIVIHADQQARRAGSWLVVGKRPRIEYSTTRRRPSAESTEARHSESGTAAPDRRRASAREPSSNGSIARPSCAQNSIWPAIERSAISAVNRASRMSSSDNSTGWLMGQG